MSRLKIEQNEKGMALISVLMVIIIFIIIGSVVINLAVTNSKQISKTEQSLLAEDLAEMGISYYQNAVFMLLHNSLQTQAIATYTRIEEEGAPITSEQLSAEIIRDIESAISGIGLSNFISLPSIPTSKLISEDKEKEFIIENIQVNYNEAQITIDFISTGKVHNQATQSIESTIIFDIQTLITAAVNGDSEGGSEGGNSYLPDLTEYTECEYNGGLENNCIYKGAVFEHVAGDMKGTEVYIDGDATFGLIAGGLKDQAILFINGNVTFDKIASGLSDYSSIFIIGDATFLESVSVKSGSMICVSGTIEGSGEGIYSWTENENICGSFGNNGISVDKLFPLIEGNATSNHKYN